MGRPKGSKNKNYKQPEESPKTTRQSTSIASSSSSSSSSTSITTGTIIHNEQTVVVPLFEGFRGKTSRGKGSRGGRGGNNNNNTIDIPDSIPSIVPTRGKGRGKGRGGAISVSSFPPTYEQQQSALNFPMQESPIPIPRPRVQKQDNNKLTNSNFLPPVAELMSRNRIPQFLNDNELGVSNNNTGIQEYRVPFSAPTIPSSSDPNNTFTMVPFGSQSVQSGGFNNNVNNSNNNNSKGRGRGRSRGTVRGEKPRGGASRRGSKKIGTSLQNPVLEPQQLLPVMNMTTDTLPSYDMAVCTSTTPTTFSSPTSTISSSSSSFSIANIPQPPSYDASRTSPDQINSIPSTSRVMTKQLETSMRNPSPSPSFTLPWTVPSNASEETFPIIKKGSVNLPPISASSSSSSNNNNNDNNNSSEESSQSHSYDSPFANNHYQQQQQFQQQIQQQTPPLPRSEVGDFNLNYNTNQVMQRPTCTSIVNENVVSSNTFNMNLMFNNADKSKADDIYNQIAGNMVYQTPPQHQQPSNIQEYPALSQQQWDNLNMGVKQKISDEQYLQQLNSGHQIPHQQSSSILYKSLQQQQQQQHFNDYPCSEIQQNNYIPIPNPPVYEKQMMTDGQHGNGQSTCISFTPFTSSLEIPITITTTNSSSTTTTNCDIPSMTDVTQSNLYPSHNTKSDFQQKQQFFPNFSDHRNTVANNENTQYIDDRGSPSTSYMGNVTTPSSNSSSFGLTTKEQTRDLEENYTGSNNEQVKYPNYNISTHPKNDLSSPHPNYVSHNNNNMSRNNASSLIDENSIPYDNRRIQSSSSSSSTTSTTTMIIQETTDSGMVVPINLPKTIHNVEGLVISHSSHEDSGTVTDSSLENNEQGNSNNFDSDSEFHHEEIANTIEIGQENTSLNTTLETLNEENSYTTESEHENIPTNTMEVENTEQEIVKRGKKTKKDGPPSVIRIKNIKGKVKELKKNKQKQKKSSASTVKKQQNDAETTTTQQQQQIESTELMYNKRTKTLEYDSFQTTNMEVQQQQQQPLDEKGQESFSETVEDPQENNNTSITTTISTSTPNDVQQTVLMSEESKLTVNDLSQITQNDESKNATADQQQQQQAGGNQKDSFRTAYRVTKDGFTPYRLNPNKQQQPPGKNRWMYNSEHKAFLFQDGKFVIERQDTFTTDDVFVWRIVEKGIGGRSCLRKFVPIQIDGRECHTGTDTFVPIRFDDYFFNNYQPVIFRMLADTKDIQIGMLYRIDRSLPLLGYLPNTEHLFPDFKNFLMELTKMAIKGEYKGDTSSGAFFEKDTDTPANPIENHFKKMIDAIVAEPKWPTDTLRCVLSYPKLNTSKSGVDKDAGCEACNSVDKKKAIGAFKLLFTGPAYDPCTLQLLDENENKDTRPTHPDFQFCHACPVTLRTLHRMMHYKWWTCVAIRAQIMDLCNQLKENEQFRAGDILEYFMGDFEWVEKMFYDFQILATEGALAINKAQKQEKFQQKRSSKRPVKASRPDQEKRKSTLPSKTTQQQDPENQEQLQLNTISGKKEESLPPVPSLHTLQKVLQSYPSQITFPESKIKRRQQPKPKPRVVKPRRKAEGQKLKTSSEISEEAQSAVENSRPKRKNTNRRLTVRRRSLDLPPPQLLPNDALQRIVKDIETESTSRTSSMNETRIQEIQTESGQEAMKEEGDEEEEGEEEEEQMGIADTPNANT